MGRRTLIHIYYYNAPPPVGKPHTQRGNQYLDKVRKVPNLTFRRARLQATQKSDEIGPYNSYKEKGLDTAPSTDFVSLAAEDELDVALIVSNDGGYEPSVRTIKELYGKQVEVIYFEGSRPFVMESCALMRVFRHSLLKEYDYKLLLSQYLSSQTSKPLLV